MTNDYLYDPQIGSELLTTEQAADYLGYHYASVRHIVSEGGLKPCAQAGKTLLFRKSALRDYKVSRKGTETAEIRTELDSIPEGTTASIEVGGSFLVEKYKRSNFTWSDIPKVRADANAKHKKDMPFTIKVRTPDGSFWKIEHEPETLLEKVFQKLSGKKKGK